MNILISGYAYIKENYFNTFKFYPEPEALSFLLPKIWKAKDGKIVFIRLKGLMFFIWGIFLSFALSFGWRLAEGLDASIPSYAEKN